MIETPVLSSLKKWRPSLPAFKMSSKIKVQTELALQFTEEELKLALVVPKAPIGKEVIQLLSLNLRDLSDEALIEKLLATLSKLEASDPRVVAVIPSHSAITRNIEIPSRDPQEIREIINLQASRHTPYSRGEIVVEYLNLGIFKSVYTKILLVIVPRATVKRYFDICEKLNLKIEKVVFAPEAVVRNSTKRSSFMNEAVPTALVHVDSASSDFMVCLKGLLLFIRNIPIGIQELGENQEENASRFVEELKKSLESYQGENIDQNPLTLVVFGALRGLENLEPRIQETLRLSVKFWPYEQGLVTTEEVRASFSDPALSFFGVVAPLLSFEELAMDFIPEENKLKRVLEERGKEIVTTAVLSMICLGLVCMILLTHYLFRTSQIDQLTRRFEPIKKEAQSLEEAYRKIQAIRTHLASRGKAIESLGELYDLTPRDVYLTDIRFDESGKISLKGTSLSRSSIFALVGGMEGSPLYRNVQTKYVMTKTEEGLELSDFEIVALLE